MSDRWDGFTVNLFEDDSGRWIAHFNELPEVSVSASTPEDALRGLDGEWAGVKASYASAGVPIPTAPARRAYSGQFNVRIDRRLHRALAMEAASAGVTLNALVAQKLGSSRHA